MMEFFGPNLHLGGGGGCESTLAIYFTSKVWHKKGQQK